MSTKKASIQHQAATLAQKIPVLRARIARGKLMASEAEAELEGLTKNVDPLVLRGAEALLTVQAPPEPPRAEAKGEGRR